jgi:Secretion system C-terminal sorting domain
MIPDAKRLLLFALIIFGHATILFCQPVISTDPEPTYLLEARARNGASGYEGVLFTPGNPSPGTAATQLNPVGAPAWSYGQFHNFEFRYSHATGTATWNLDFNRDGDFLDAEESTTSVSPGLVNYGFYYVNIWMQGNNLPALTASINNLTINGVNFGTYTTSGSAPTSVLFEESSGNFINITVTGSLSFSGGAGQERPRFYLRLGALVLLPSSITDFNGIATADGRSLSWSVSDEQSVRAYGIERSRDAVSFAAIGTISARNQPGLQTYRFRDPDPSGGPAYYRLRTIDLDGRETLSRVLRVQEPTRANGIAVYPNPARETVTIARPSAGKAELKIFQQAGRMVAHRSLQDATESVSLRELKPGLYVLYITTQGNTEIHRLVVQ